MKEATELFKSIGITVVRDDEVGFQRAKNFTEEIGLEWKQDWYIYGGKVFVKPGSKDEIAGSSDKDIPQDHEVLGEVPQA